MTVAKAGDNVQVHYKGTLTDGTQFDSSEGREPLAFQLGGGMVIKGFDDGVTGMRIGEKKQVLIPAAEAYGESNPDMIFTFNRADMPQDMQVQVGDLLNMHADGNAQEVQVVVTELTDEFITVDANHELAGQDLVFDLELVRIDA